MKEVWHTNSTAKIFLIRWYIYFRWHHISFGYRTIVDLISGSVAFLAVALLG